jgi:hypothetical protein
VLLSPRLEKAKKPGNTTGTSAPAVGLGAPPLAPGAGPGTASACGMASGLLPQTPTGPGIQRECFFGADNTTAVQATIERVLERVDGVDYVHARLTFNPHFVDNSYGVNAVGWQGSKNGTHTFKDLVGSDHAELIFENGRGEVALHVKLDYISQDASRPSGYGSLGVSGGEGKVLAGNAAHIAAVTTSLDRNLNGCGYGQYTQDSPATDAAYTPNPKAPNWDYRVTYELWIRAAAFGTAGVGPTYIESVHASPSKTGSNTVIVAEGPCPPDSPEAPQTPPGTPGEPNPGSTPGSTPDNPPSTPWFPPITIPKLPPITIPWFPPSETPPGTPQTPPDNTGSGPQDPGSTPQPGSPETPDNTGSGPQDPGSTPQPGSPETPDNTGSGPQDPGSTPQVPEGPDSDRPPCPAGWVPKPETPDAPSSPLL